MKVFDSGAKSSERKPAYHLLPVEGISRGAQRMAEGAASHGERNYERGADDPAFVKDRENHLIEHAILYAAGDRSTDHLGAIIANACMLARLEVLKSKPCPVDQPAPDLTGHNVPGFPARPGIAPGSLISIAGCGCAADATGEP